MQNYHAKHTVSRVGEVKVKTTASAHWRAFKGYRFSWWGGLSRQRGSCGKGNACQQMRGSWEDWGWWGKGRFSFHKPFSFGILHGCHLLSHRYQQLIKPFFPTQTWKRTAWEHQWSSSQYHPLSMGWNVWLQLQVSSVLARLRVRAAGLQQGRLLLQALAAHPFGPLLGDQLQGISRLLGLQEEGEGAADLLKN